MFSNKENVNILTSLLIANGISDAVVCPGSRNAPIVHNLNATGLIRCHPVTDERSAGFYALGIALATNAPVVVCVTSGSALLNLAPAVAEAFYRHQPLIVVSADRPQQWIGQLDGQTLPQQGAFGPMVRRSVTLPEPHNEEERWHCNRLVNEALFVSTCHGSAPGHINVPISEPLFTFDVERLPAERELQPMQKVCSFEQQKELFASFYTASRPMIVIGQTLPGMLSADTMRQLRQHYVVLAEPLGNSSAYDVHADEAVRAIGDDEAYRPDFIIYVGDTIVSKPVRKFLRRAKADVCMLTLDARTVADPLMSLTGIVELDNPENIDQLLLNLCNLYDDPAEYADDENIMQHEPSRRAFFDLWKAVLDAAASHAEYFEPPYSQMAVVKYFEQQLEDIDFDCQVHYANSTAVRLASIYAAHPVWCNRGVNGIEGSLSTAAGFSLATQDRVFCIIGDLSFFYDQNALWNQCLGGNLRIILLNNGGGGIFRQLPGLDQSPVADTMVGGSHKAEARGICTQNDIGYLKASNMQEMQIGVVTLLTQESQRPMLLEVFTDADTDAQAMKQYFEAFLNSWQ